MIQMVTEGVRRTELIQLQTTDDLVGSWHFLARWVRENTQPRSSGQRAPGHPGC
jgi:hypothetical protein